MFEWFQKILKIDDYINVLAVQLGSGLYIVLFAVIFAETGLVFFPFLPGDSLLFAVGALASSSPYFEIAVLIPLLISASLLGDSTNYYIGRKYGRSLFETKHVFSKFMKPKYLHDTEDFYKKRGDLAVVFARYIPIVRTLAPFVAGVTMMPYRKFLTYSIVGSVSWVSIFTLAGYFFGQIPFIKHNFTFLILGVIAFSMLPIFIGFLKKLLKN